MKTLNKMILAAFLPLVIGPLTASATDPLIWSSNASATSWKTPAGQCWRSPYWTPAMATEECDPDLFKKAEVPPPVKVAEVAPPPPPVVVAPPPPPPAPIRTELRKVSFSAEDLFDFDSAALRPEGKSKLDDLVTKLNVTTNEQIVATGHTDRIGKDSYNQKLSERRAESVRDYLIGKGMLENQVRAEGKGETQPVTNQGECKGALSKKLKACLQPDRRVEVEVVATKEVTLAPK